MHKRAVASALACVALLASASRAVAIPQSSTLAPNAYLAIAFIASDGGGLQTVGVSANGLEPLGSADTQLKALDTFIGSNAAYVAAGSDGLVVFDVGDPARPKRIASAATNGTAIAVEGTGNMVYVLWMKCPTSPGPDQTCRGGIDGFLVTNPYLPRLVSRYEGLPSPTDLTIKSPYIYVAWSECGFGCLGGLEVIDFADVTQPRRAAGLSSTAFYPTFRMHLTESNNVESSFSRTISLTAGGDVRTIDVTDPMRPEDRGLNAETPGEARDVDFFGYTIAVADGEAGVFVEQRFGLPLASASPHGKQRITRDANGVAVVPTSGQAVAIVADGNGSALLVSVTDDAPLLDEVALPGRPAAVTVVDPSQVPSTGPQPGTFSIDAFVRSGGSNGPRVDDGTTFAPGDNLAVCARVSQRAYVEISVTSPGGTPAVYNGDVEVESCQPGVAGSTLGERQIVARAFDPSSRTFWDSDTSSFNVNAAPPPITATHTPTATGTASATARPAPDTPSPPPATGPQTVVLIPGLAGSQLDNEPVDGCTGHPRGPVWLPIDIGEILGTALKSTLPFEKFRPLVEPVARRLSVLRLDARGVLPVDSCDQVRATGLLEQMKVVDGVSYVFRREWQDLTQRLVGAGHTVVACPYDWRLSPKREALFRLRACIEQAAAQAPTRKVVLLGHSMGGLLGAWYISDAGRANSISQLITVGSPILGAPVMVRRLLTGETGVDLIDQVTVMPSAQGVLDRSLIKSIYRNSPGFMSVLPSAGYERSVGAAIFDAAADPFSGPQPRIGTEFESFLASRGANASLVADGRAFHAEIEGALLVPKVHWTALAASHRADTVGSITISVAGPTRREVMDVRMVNGDGTVPAGSAIYLDRKIDESLVLACEYLGGGLAPERRHDTLVGDPKIGDDIIRLLAGNEPTHCSPVSILTPVLHGDHVDTVNRQYSELPSAYEVTILGSVRAYARDTTTGATIGWLSDGTRRSDLESVQMITTPDQTTFTATTARPISVGIVPFSEAPWQVRVIRHVIDGSDSGPSSADERLLFLDPPWKAGESLNLALTDPSNLDSARLTILDAHGASTTIAPSSRVNGAAARDLTPPVTTVQVSGNRNADGDVVGNAEIRLTAADAGSGVQGTSYSVDGGKSWTAYSGPFTVAAGVHPRLAAYSVDRAGNSGPPVDVVLRRSASLYLPMLATGAWLRDPQPSQADICMPSTAVNNDTLSAALAEPPVCPDALIDSSMAPGDVTDFVVVRPSAEGALSFTLWTPVGASDPLDLALFDEFGQPLSAAVERRDDVVHLVRWVTAGLYGVRVRRQAAVAEAAYRFRWSVMTSRAMGSAVGVSH